MPNKLNLRGFLRQEIIRSRIKTGSNDPAGQSSFSLSAKSLDRSDVPEENLYQAGTEDCNSLFNEPTAETSNQDCIETRVEKFLTCFSSERRPEQYESPQVLQESRLHALRDELRILVEGEAGTCERGKAFAQRQKPALIQEIAEIEVQEREEKIKRFKGRFIRLLSRFLLLANIAS